VLKCIDFIFFDKPGYIRPAFLENIKDEDLRAWAGNLNELWRDLGRKIGSEVYLRPERYSQLYVPNPVIVPGDRFREFYYWYGSS
jgi:alpha,alpha-trehalase